MARFIAIPVTKGDAFYLDRDDLSVLVDGGQDRLGFASTFETTTGSDGVGVIVCTHNDADHANGVLGFLQGGLRCDEIWLPGRWLNVLPDLLKPFVEVFAELAKNVTEVEVPSEREQRRSGLPAIEAYADHLLERFDDAPASQHFSPIGEDGWPESYLHIFDDAKTREIAPFARWWPQGDRPPWPDFTYRIYSRLGPHALELLWSAIESARRIRTIAMEAFHRGIRVRWFEFDAMKPSGGIEGLQPINARAIVGVRPFVGRLLDWLALTVSNRESLVFWSPPTDNHPGVLFTADSDLSRLNLPHQLVNAIVTSPHHGAEDNAKAYQEVGKAARQNVSSITWVRSDCRYRGRPGQTYLSLSSQRLCTICRLGGGMWSPKRPVHLSSRGGTWVPQPATALCSCQ